jgi:hypothetical protein
MYGLNYFDTALWQNVNGCCCCCFGLLLTLQYISRKEARLVVMEAADEGTRILGCPRSKQAQ